MNSKTLAVLAIVLIGAFFSMVIYSASPKGDLVTRFGAGIAVLPYDCAAQSEPLVMRTKGRGPITRYCDAEMGVLIYTWEAPRRVLRVKR